ncbi:MAG: EamA family transporter [Thermodesulfobacteriota bacterium]
MDAKKPLLLPYLALASAVLLWGLSFVATKIALAGLPPLCILFLRFALASLFFLAWFGRRGLPRLSRADLLRVARIAAFMPVAYFILETYGIKFTTASKASLLAATIPLVVLLVSAWGRRERPRPRVLAGAALSLPGVGLLVAGGGDAGLLSGPQLGDLYMSGAVLAAAAYMILAGRLGPGVSCVDLTGLQMIAGALVFAPFFLAGMGDVAWADAGRPLAATLALALGPTIAGFLSYNYALSRIPAPRASLGINLVPVVTAAGAWALLGERLAPLQMAGGLLVLLAVALATAPDRRLRAPAARAAEPAGARP